MRPRYYALVLGTVLISFVLVACGGNSPKPAAAAQPSGQTNRGGLAAGQGGPAASGLIAEIDGDTLQVQNQSSGQVAVKVTSKTSYTQTKTARLSDVTVGSCVFASAEPSTGGTATTPSSAASPAAAPTAITATTVMISKPSGGTCGINQLAGGGGSRPTSFPSGIPTDLPGGVRPSGGAARQLGLGEVLSGKVTAVSGSTISVEVTARGVGQTGTPTASPSTTIGTITVTSSTTFTHTVAATKAALRVGLCATATGKTDSAGTVTASRLALSTAGANGCTTGFIRGSQPTGSATSNG